MEPGAGGELIECHMQAEKPAWIRHAP